LSALLLYAVTTVAVVLAWRRFVQPISLLTSVVLLLLPLVFTGRALLTGRVYGPVELPFMSEPLKDYRGDYGIGVPHNEILTDLSEQIIPWRQAVRVAMAQHEWPLWNPYLLCGDVLAANAQSAPYDPVNLLGLLIPIAPSITYGAAMGFFLAGFFTFAFCRKLESSEVAALAAAAGFMYCGQLAFTIGWPLGRAWTWFPLVMFAARAVVRDADLRAAILLTTSLVLTIFAGHPESILHIVATGAAYGLFELLTFRREGGTATRRALLLAVVSGGVALALTAIFLLPFMEASQQTVEGRLRREVYAPAHYDTTLELIGRRVGGALLPFYGGQPWHDNITPLWDPQLSRCGSLVLALAAVGLFASPRRHGTWFFGVLALIAFAAAITAWPVAHLLHALPLFNIAINDRLGYAALFSLAVLAAAGLDAMHVRPARSAAILGIVTLLLALLTAIVLPGQLRAGVHGSLITLNVVAELLPLLIAGGLVVFRVRGAAAAIVLLLLVQRATEDGSIYPAVKARDFYPRVPLLAAMPPSAVPWRMVGRSFALLPNAAALYDLEDARGYEAMTFERLAQTYPLWSQPQPVSFNLVNDLSRPFLSALNVRYAITSSDAAPPDGWSIVRDDRQSRLLENRRVLPRAFLPKSIRFRPSGKSVLTEMAAATDFGETAWIEVPEQSPQDFPNPPGTLTVRKDGPGFAIAAVMQGNGWMVLSESAWRGWRVYIDGRRVQTHHADHALLGIYVPAGRHDIRARYLPESFTRGRAISFVTLAVLMLGAAGAAVRNYAGRPRTTARTDREAPRSA
jgi:hypothetical protein